MSGRPPEPDGTVDGALEVLRSLARLPVEPGEVPDVLAGLEVQAGQMATLHDVQFPFTAPSVVTPLTSWAWLVDQAAALAGVVDGGAVDAAPGGGMPGNATPGDGAPVDGGTGAASGGRAGG